MRTSTAKARLGLLSATWKAKVKPDPKAIKKAIVQPELKFRLGYTHHARSTSSKRTQIYAKGVSIYPTLRFDKTTSRRTRRNLLLKRRKTQMLERLVFDRKPPLKNTSGKKRIYFSGTNDESPPNLPKDPGTGSFSVRSYFKGTSGCMVNDLGDRSDGVNITDRDGHVIAVLANKNSRGDIFNSHTSQKIMDELLTGRPIGAKRSYSKEPICSTTSTCIFSCLGPKCNRTTTGISDLSSKMTTEQRNEIYRIITQVEKVTTGNLDRDYIKAHIDMMKQMKIPGFKGRNQRGVDGATKIFPNMALGKNVYLPAHKDHDCKYSVVSICDSQFCRNADIGEILAYFCFPGESSTVYQPKIPTTPRLFSSLIPPTTHRGRFRRGSAPR